MKMEIIYRKELSFSKEIEDGKNAYADITIDKVNKDGKIAIVMGSEGKGMRRLVQENCDTSVKLKISENVESLNVSTAAAIALYELRKD